MRMPLRASACRGCGLPYSHAPAIPRQKRFRTKDGREVRVAPDALRKYFGSIAADEVKQIRVVRGNKFQKYPAKLYVTTK